MLTLLRELEESALNLIKQYIRRGSQSRLASPTEQPDMTTGGPLSASAMRVSAQRESILVLDQREDEFNFYEESGTRAAGAVGQAPGGYPAADGLWKTEGLRTQQSILYTVDEVLFCRSKSGARGWI
ncbi:hypothetical protein EDB87DRAFT_1581779 [Lactarius vividus]|nr:hypothetical protein EDB87DRAFT_1581779 [Lactarius vividus]